MYMERQQALAISTVSPPQEPLRISDPMWSMMITTVQLTGIVLLAVGAITLVQKPNSVDQFIGIQDRTPTVASMRYVGEIALMGWGFLMALTASQAGERARSLMSQICIGLYQQWQRLAQWMRLLMTGLILLAVVGWNMSQIMSVPFSYTRAWDLEAAVYRSAKEAQLIEIIAGLEEGCILCTPGSQPIENISTGDDIGQFFFFGVGHKLGFFPASLAGYQQFIALSFAIIIVLSAVIVTLGFRSLMAGIILAIIITLLDNTKYYQSMLITSYWVPGGAALLSASMGLGMLGRANLDQTRAIKPAYWFYYVTFGLWGLVAGWAFLGRSSAGPITLVSAMIILPILVIKLRRVIRWLPAMGLLAAGFVVALASFQLALEWRLTHYNLSRPIPNTMVTHAFSHAILVGMGYVTNDEGLAWNDEIGALLAEQACPGALYLGPDYYNCVRDIVIKLVANDPNLLIRNILAKTEAMIQVTFSFFPFALVALVALYVIRRLSYYVVFGLLLALNAAPSLLTVPYASYLQGYFQIFVILIAAGVIVFGVRVAKDLEAATDTQR